MRRVWIAAAAALAALSAPAAHAQVVPPTPLPKVPPNTSFQWQIDGGTIDQSYQSLIYDVDLDFTDAATISSLRAAGHIVVCYFSAGTWENFRPDAASFPAAVKGKPYEAPYQDELWLNVKNIAVLGPIMTARMQKGVGKGCQGFEFDDVDGFDYETGDNPTGFSLTADDQLTYDKFLADTAHSLGALAVLKNTSPLAAQLVAWFDFSLTEQCHQYGFCDLFAPFINAGKAVFDVEYEKKYYPAVCTANGPKGIDSQLKKTALDGSRTLCKTYTDFPPKATATGVVVTTTKAAVTTTVAPGTTTKTSTATSTRTTSYTRSTSTSTATPPPPPTSSTSTRTSTKTTGTTTQTQTTGTTTQTQTTGTTTQTQTTGTTTQTQTTGTTTQTQTTGTTTQTQTTETTTGTPTTTAVPPPPPTTAESSTETTTATLEPPTTTTAVPPPPAPATTTGVPPPPPPPSAADTTTATQTTAVPSPPPPTSSTTTQTTAVPPPPPPTTSTQTTAKTTTTFPPPPPPPTTNTKTTSLTTKGTTTRTTTRVTTKTTTLTKTTSKLTTKKITTTTIPAGSPCGNTAFCVDTSTLPTVVSPAAGTYQVTVRVWTATAKDMLVELHQSSGSKPIVSNYAYNAIAASTTGSYTTYTFVLTWNALSGPPYNWFVWMTPPGAGWDGQLWNKEVPVTLGSGGSVVSPPPPGAPPPPPPSPPSGIPISTDSSCGSGVNKYCPNSQCCSQYGWCGTTTDYCGTGCQPGFGKCT
ncbi:carbohydrate-binding module family 18 protein [Gonapodya prolifera JEL478]|uniref:alpha-galactosidase n=1 Tax=Gonapodya prolifera (strain JEL478) TaxID=1344416 RepID=A0A139ASG9_GONPJ|nr:carbohydrate-binding module family 18 protein [Gonapodya prolifera JEL478]|eukprot:KXS19690.1 carbohydrate-binding module family 18 protein [Gonapodya prolifera JEL478]